jgi:hypothetical protein
LQIQIETSTIEQFVYIRSSWGFWANYFERGIWGCKKNQKGEGGWGLEGAIFMLYCILMTKFSFFKNYLFLKDILKIQLQGLVLQTLSVTCSNAS